MSRHAEDLTWERARCGKTELLMLVKIADLADDEGRNAWPEVPRLMKYCRTSERATQYILRRLERDREVDIEFNEMRRAIVLKGGRTFRPKWFIHVRCVCDWEVYQLEGKPAKSAGFELTLRQGRTARKPADFAGSCAADKPQLSTGKPASTDEVNRKKTYGGYIGIDPAVDPAEEQEQGLRPSPPVENPVEIAQDNIRVITKVVHEVLDLFAQADDVTEGDVIEAVKRHCAQLHITYDSAVVWQALASAVVQRRRVGKDIRRRG